MDFNFDFGTVMFLLSGVSFVVGYAAKKFPETDPYFKTTAFTLAEVDDILDGFLKEFPNNPALNKVDDVVEKLCDELRQAGYKVKETDKKKIKNRVKGKAAKADGLTMNYDPGTETTSLEYNKEF